MILEPKFIYSDCCGCPDKIVGDTSYEDFGICSGCMEHCEYVPEEDEIEKDFITNEEI